MTFSVAKSYLAVLAGIAFADGLIADPRERVGDRITDGGFDSEQNRSITWEEIDGRRLQSVPGGSHWGGGLWIGARDQARLGQLILQKGRWGGRELLPAAWCARMLSPCAINPEYGYLWWLNSGRQ